MKQISRLTPMRVVTISGWLLLAGLLLALLTTNAYARQADADIAQAPTAAVYLPVVAKMQPVATPTPAPTVTQAPGATPPTATPTATATNAPTVHTGFFALSDWLTYNAATFVDAQGGVHLAFYTSDERHGDDPPRAAHLLHLLSRSRRCLCRWQQMERPGANG